MRLLLCEVGCFGSVSYCLASVIARQLLPAVQCGLFWVVSFFTVHCELHWAVSGSFVMTTELHSSALTTGLHSSALADDHRAPVMWDDTSPLIALVLRN